MARWRKTPGRGEWVAVPDYDPIPGAQPETSSPERAAFEVIANAAPKWAAAARAAGSAGAKLAMAACVGASIGALLAQPAFDRAVEASLLRAEVIDHVIALIDG